MINPFKEKIEIKYNEKEILCNVIDTYINIAKVNNNSLDDYISIIALIKMFQKQYKKYYNSFNKYIIMFKENGQYYKYIKSKSNLAKKYFKKYGTNPRIAYNYLYSYIPESPSRFIHYLILIGLTGKPKTKFQYHILSTIYNANSVSFYKQRIYYNELYIYKGMYRTGYETYSKKYQIARLSYYLGDAYKRAGDYYNAIRCFYIANSQINYSKEIIDVFIKFEKINEAYAFLEKQYKLKRIDFETYEKYKMKIQRKTCAIRRKKENEKLV